MPQRREISKKKRVGTNPLSKENNKDFVDIKNLRAEIPASALSGPELFKALSRDAWAIVSTAIVVAIGLWEAVALGFYLDDWAFIVWTQWTGGGPFSLVRWIVSKNLSRARPGQDPIWYIGSSLFGQAPFPWHLALFASNILLIFLMFRLARQLSGPLTLGAGRILYVSILFWFILPWNVVFLFWPTEIVVVLFLDLFAASAVFILGRWGNNVWAFVVPFVLYLWACVGYEAVYFQWFPIAVLAALSVVSKRANLRRVLYGLAALITAQGCAVAWYFMALRLYGPGITNPIVPTWPQMFVRNVLMLPRAMVGSTVESTWLFVPAALVWATLILSAYTQAFWRGTMRRTATVSVLQIAVCITGACLSLVAYSLGGRMVAGVGVDTRAWLLINFWFLIAAALATAFCWTYYSVRQIRVAVAVLALACVAGGGALLAGHLQRAEEWATGWKIQQRIIADTPVSEIKKLPAGSVVLLVKPFDYNGVPTISQIWDAKAAMWSQHPETKDVLFDVYNHWRGPAVWDGYQLTYPGMTQFTATNLYIWRPMEHQFFKAVTPTRIDIDMSIHAYLQ